MTNFGISHKDTIYIISKEDGSLSRAIKAKVTPELIVTFETDLIIKEGDQVQRDLSNGESDRYDIYGVHFTEHGMIKPPSYELKVLKTTTLQSQSSSQIIYILNGSNTRVYHNSIDQSSNVVRVSSPVLFEELKKTIKSQIPENYILLLLVDAMEKASGSPSFLESYLKFIEESAEHLLILYPFIPGLSSLINT